MGELYCFRSGIMLQKFAQFSNLSDILWNTGLNIDQMTPLNVDTTSNHNTFFIFINSDKQGFTIKARLSQMSSLKCPDVTSVCK